ncbi:MAG: glutathione peroxidase [Pirellula sp.]|jgi:glutathione peroxidase|nr:glutathione peroxidase [Pirellula sp.]
MNTRSLLAGIVAMAMLSAGTMDENVFAKPPALAFTMKSLTGDSVELEKYEGKVVLFVNVASNCGYTKQYSGLQKLHETYGDKGLVVVGVPCNQFGGQEPGTSKEIQQFCSSKYNVTFDMLEKVNVNDDSKKNIAACDLFKYLTSVDVKPVGKGPVKWNFEKFLVDRKGNVVARFSSGVTPESSEMISAIEKALAAE